MAKIAYKVFYLLNNFSTKEQKNPLPGRKGAEKPNHMKL
jgi:hypothetical protein